jgi:hypothetical protein
MSKVFSNAIEVRPQEASLQRLERLAELLDSALPVPGTRFRVGLDSIFGFIPGIGDAAGAAVSTYLIFEAARLGVSVGTLLRMVGNVAIETVIGAVPLLGDLFDVFWKANLKNLALLRAGLARGDLHHRTPSQLGRLFVVPLLVVVLALSLSAIVVLTLVAKLVFG